MATLKRALPPNHPGELLREIVLPALAKAGTPRTQVAELLGIGRRTLYDVLEKRRPVTPELALRLAKLLNGSPEMWLNMQRDYDLYQVRAQLGDALAAIPTLEVEAGAAAA